MTRNKENDEGLKALLAASNDSCFVLTSNPKIHQKKGKWCMLMNRRLKKTCSKRKRVNSSCYLAKKGAETELFQFRHSKEHPESKILTENKVKELKG